MKKYLIVLLLPLIILSCNFKAKNNSETSKDEKIQENETNEGMDFWNSLKSLNGKAFEGQLIGVQSNDDFVGKKLVMHVLYADKETVQIIPAAFSNVWWVTVNDTSYTYNLRRMGTDRLFTVAFDLKNEIDIPSPSWGWENFGK
ncbi:MAG: hypothetical protein Q8R96_03235 [Bacteroidota bacterium]|nr:hypothetical protein [Bacteroidota bacterium]